MKLDQASGRKAAPKFALRAALLVTAANCVMSLAGAQILYQPKTPQFNAKVPLTTFTANPRTGTVRTSTQANTPAIQFLAPGQSAVVPVSWAGNGPAAVSLGTSAPGQAAFPAPAVQPLVSPSFPTPVVQPLTQPVQQAPQQRNFIQQIASVVPVVFPVFGGSGEQPPTGTANTTSHSGAAAVALGPAPVSAPAPRASNAAFPAPANNPVIAPNLTTLQSQTFIENSGGDDVVSFTSSLNSTSAVAFPAPGEAPTPATNVNASIGGTQVDAFGNTTYSNLEQRYGAGENQPAATLISGPLTASEVATLDLAGLLGRTINTDSRVTGLEFRLDASDSQAQSLRGEWRPRLETGYETDYNLLQGTTNNAILAVRQRIFDFGRTDAALKTNAARRVLSGAQIEDMRFTVATEFMSAYLNFITAERGIQADTREIGALRSALDANQRLADSGAASIIAARQSQIDLNQALSRQSERRLSQSQAEQQLSSLAGIAIRPSASSFDAMAAQYVPGSPDQCIAQAISSDPGLSVIEAQLIEAATHINEIAIQNLPSIDLIGQTGFSPFSASPDLGIRQNTGFNIAINGNLFDGGVNKAEVQAQELRIRELQRERSTVERELELDIRRAYTSARTLSELLSTQQSSLSVLRSLISDRQRQADAGVGLLQDVLRAQVEFEQAQNALTEIQSDLDRERARLVLLCGNRF